MQEVWGRICPTSMACQGRSSGEAAEWLTQALGMGTSCCDTSKGGDRPPEGLKDPRMSQHRDAASPVPPAAPLRPGSATWVGNWPCSTMVVASPSPHHTGGQQRSTQGRAPAALPAAPRAGREPRELPAALPGCPRRFVPHARARQAQGSSQEPSPTHTPASSKHAEARPRLRGGW